MDSEGTLALNGRCKACFQPWDEFSDHPSACRVGQNTLEGEGGSTECIGALGKRGSCEGKVVLGVILKLDITGSTSDGV